MPVTADQAKMLATLAIDCRPVGARRWDAAGVMANIRKVADRDLPGVILAVIQAAEDRNAETPGVIATSGPHWRAPDPLRPAPPGAKFDPNSTCSVCGFSQPECRRRWPDDHEFESVEAAKVRKARTELDVHRAVVGLKEAAMDELPAKDAPEPSTKGTEHVAPIRDALHPRTIPSQPEHEAASVAAEEAS